jgi:energy-coupling factor transporter ATP-binding protein EcfA2
MTDQPPLVERARRLTALAERRWALAGIEGGARRRARQLRDHVRDYIVPRAGSLDAPLVVVLLGPTGAGKSTLLNTLAGAPLSTTGVLRPTTRQAVLAARPADARTLLEGPLASLPRDRIRVADIANGRAGVALVDAPDVDSLEHDNRAVADALVETADLCIFITTAVRYADRVPWEVLGRVRERGLPLLVVVNRLPPDEADVAAVLGDVERLFRGAGHAAAAEPPSQDGAPQPHEPGTDPHGARIEIVGVREGDLDSSIDGLRGAAVAPILARIDALAADASARRALAARALAGALAGVATLAHAVADDLEHEAIDVDALDRLAVTSYAEELEALSAELRGGRFLREEVLRHWQSFVGADQVTRLFATGIGRLRGAVTTLLQGTPTAPVGIVEEETTSDLVAVGTAHVAEAARRTAARWSERPLGETLLEAEPALWGPGPDAAGELETRLRDWVTAIAADVQATGAPKRTLARGASVGVNAAGVMVMLSVFSHTGGITGAEVGVAAATAFLNQKLLHALFGEAAMVEMIDRARTRLGEAFAAVFAADRARYERLVPDSAELRSLAAELRSSVEGLGP